ncbi:RNA ligase 1 family protein [Streptacidiphilus griseoplanus]|uniref:RNA ligase 1 family protein n=1 Tax=Peterkaempfera griseoplana TaxID=66896 RepID=UPI0006E39A59|nr:DUF5565 family protein [Peterkaempfera griseoplana]
MKKIPTVFARDFGARPAHVVDEVNPVCAWVLAGEGRATRKFDGTCVKLDEHGAWWARREVRADKPAPAGYVPVSTDPTTGRTVGWEPIEQSPFAKFHAEAVRDQGPAEGVTGTFELIGPKINGNPERRTSHVLVEHARALDVEVPELTFEGIRRTVLALAEADGCEGVVWHHPDGRMAKIKARDFPAAAR